MIINMLFKLISCFLFDYFNFSIKTSTIIHVACVIFLLDSTALKQSQLPNWSPNSSIPKPCSFFFFFFCARKILLNLYFSHGSFPLSVSQLHVVSNLSFSVCRQDSPTMQATPLHSPHLCNLIFISYHAAYVLAKQMFCQFHISVLYSCSFPQQSFFKFHHFSSLCSFYFFKECI